MSNFRIVGRSGILFLGKAFAGQRFTVKERPNGDIFLRRAPEVPENERWIHEPKMKEQLNRADEWLRRHPAQETDLACLEAKLGV